MTKCSLRYWARAVTLAISTMLKCFGRHKTDTLHRIIQWILITLWSICYVRNGELTTVGVKQQWKSIKISSSFNQTSSVNPATITTTQMKLWLVTFKANQIWQMWMIALIANYHAMNVIEVPHMQKQRAMTTFLYTYVFVWCFCSVLFLCGILCA